MIAFTIKVIEVTLQDFYKRVLKVKLNQDYEAAILDFNIAININPKNSSTYLYRWYSKFMISDLKGACKDWLLQKS